MILAYNFLFTLTALLLIPLLAIIILVRKKYRGKTLERLGLATPQIHSGHTGSCSGGGKTIWIHALSVGEVTSALPLVKAIHKTMPSAVIVFTVATRSGKQIAEKILSAYVSSVLYSPFDFWFSVRHYINAIRPDLFILVETDFWPNWLWQLKNKKIPIMLVNGRISEKSFAAYKKFRFFFLPMFRCFRLFSMQTKADSQNLAKLGINSDNIITLGNLKYDLDIGPSENSPVTRSALGIDPLSAIFICGSTHPGEEKILFATFAELNKQHKLFLLLAPRDISRGGELVKLAQSFGLKARTRKQKAGDGNVLILNTIGELGSCYRLAKLAFVGGSLVPCGGHNPIEPAAFGVPVLFGQHMEDFAEIAEELKQCGGAKTVTKQTLSQIVGDILATPDLHQEMAENCLKLIQQHRGSMGHHIQAIEQLLNN